MRGFRNLSLRSAMVLGGEAIVLIPLIIVAVVTFTNSTRTLERMSRLQAAQIASGLSGVIQLALEKEMTTLSALAKDPLVVDAARRGRFLDLDPKLVDLFQKIGVDYEGLGVFDTKGTIQVEATGRDRIGISIAMRGYFADAKLGKSGIGPPNASVATGQPVFGLSVPIMSRSGRFLGGVLGVIKADFLVHHIGSMKLGATGYSFMLDQHGIIIAHPNPAFILSLDTLRDEELAGVAARMIRQETGAEEYVYRGTKKLAGFAPIGLTGWSVGVTQDMDEIMALAYANRDFMMLVGCVFFIVTFLAIFFFSRTLSAPLQKTLTTLNQALEQASETVAIIGLDRLVQYANPAMARVFERPVRDLCGKAPVLDNREGVDAESIWGILEKGSVWSGTLTGNRKDGTPFFLETTITPVRNKAGAINGFLGIGRDITRELKMDAQIRRGQKMEALGTLAGGIAHDFNNILAAIFGFTELTQASLADREQSSLYLAEIMHAAGRARDLVGQIMTFSRQTETERRPLAPKRIIGEALRLMRASLPATIEIRASLKSDASILGDPTQVHQVIINLCTNSGYAMRETGGILEVDLDEIELDESLAASHPGLSPGWHLRLRVADTGCGVPPEIMDRIFDPFFTTKPPGEGTGLGLSVVHGIVRMLDGEITASSRVGEGTTFTVLLPIIPVEQQPALEQGDAALPGGTERILLVDDEEPLARVVKALLESLGYRVREFTSSLDAWEAFEKDPYAFDAVITDHTMPQMTGSDLARRLRGIRGDIPIILCSGYIDAPMEEKARRAGVTDLTRKPIARSEIALLLRRVFSSAGNASQTRKGEI